MHCANIASLVSSSRMSASLYDHLGYTLTFDHLTAIDYMILMELVELFDTSDVVAEDHFGRYGFE